MEINEDELQTKIADKERELGALVSAHNESATKFNELVTANQVKANQLHGAIAALKELLPE